MTSKYIVESIKLNSVAVNHTFLYINAIKHFHKVRNTKQ